MKNSITNNKMTVTIKSLGAEICSLISHKTQKEYIWQADPKIWARSSPILFPIVGPLKNGEYEFKEKRYHLNQHGFAKDREHSLIEQSKDTLKYCLKADESTLENYPFDFELFSTYRLIEKTLNIHFEVVNKDNKTMWFSLGAHPAINCNIADGNQVIIFDQSLPMEYYERNLVNGLIERNKLQLIKEGEFLTLNYKMFDNGALFIESENRESIVLIDKHEKEKIKINFRGFPILGLWTKKDASFICIEPCYGLCDFVEATGSIKDKLFIQTLEPEEVFECSYQIEIL